MKSSTENDYAKLKYELAYVIHYAAEAIRHLESGKPQRAETSLADLKDHARCVGEIHNGVQKKQSK